jgi:hypothetical protein
MLLKRAFLLVLLAGCPSPELPECDLLSTTDVVLVAEDPNSVISDVTDGSQVTLMSAPQGGHILLAGARVRASSDCQLAATASLRDPNTQRVIALEQRPLLLDKRADGWAVPQQGLNAMPNIAVCPNSAASTSVDGHPFLLEVSLATLDGTPIVTASAMVTPTCADSYCTGDCAGPGG